MKTPSRKPVLLIASVTTAALLMGSGGAVAGSLITSKQIKDGTVTSADIKNGTINLRDIRLFARRALAGQDGADGTDGAAGPAGPAGPAGTGGGEQGPAGPAGPAGPQGSPGTNGTNGAAGKDGATWTSGDTPPTGTSGKPGDLFLETDTGDVYLRGADAWGTTPIANLKGADGTGATGGTVVTDDWSFFEEVVLPANSKIEIIDAFVVNLQEGEPCERPYGNAFAPGFNLINIDSSGLITQSTFSSVNTGDYATASVTANCDSGNENGAIRVTYVQTSLAPRGPQGAQGPTGPTGPTGD
ncbi:MAG: collagen-like protein [Nocardioides sp.]|nr:collagen-like protein [Nocardioides sp.]